MVGHTGKSHGAEEDRVVMANPLEPILGHHAARLRVVLAAPGKLVPLEGDAEALAGRLQHANAFGHHLLADAVSGDDRDAVLLHADSPTSDGDSASARLPCSRNLVWRYSSRPYFDPSRPYPEAFTPPKGATSEESAKSLIPTRPASRLAPT